MKYFKCLVVSITLFSMNADPKLFLIETGKEEMDSSKLTNLKSEKTEGETKIQTKLGGSENNAEIEFDGMPIEGSRDETEVESGKKGKKKNKRSAALQQISRFIERPTNLTDLTAVRIIAEGNSEFGKKLYDSVRKEKRAENLVMSPYSASSVMAMTALGARGVTLDEIREGMEFPKKRDLVEGYNNVFKLLRGNKNFTLETANQLFPQEGFQLVKDFVNVMKEKFYSNLTHTNFAASEAARKLINDWVEHKTRNKIKDLIPKGILDDLTRLVLVNAIYFKGIWKNKFVKQHTKDDDFYVEEGKVVEVKMMRIIKGKFKMVHLNDINAKAIEIPYKGQRISMYILLPYNKFGLGDVEAKLSEIKLSKLFARVNKAKERIVDLFLPKFRLENSITLTDHLKKLGMVQMFEPNADFSGISTDGGLYVYTVIQKAFIEVNEEGSEAAAATGVVMGTRSAPAPAPPRFACDHPFIFFIKDKLTQIVLFSGRLMDPTT